MSGAGLFCLGMENPSGRLSSGLTIGVEYASLFDVLAIQLLLAVARADALASCAECAMPFVRRFRVGERRHFCPSCGRVAAVRAAVRKHHDRKTTALKLFDEGRSETDVAEKTGAGLATVRRWIQHAKKEKKR
jgi:uncharacterized Zn finger protein (UPF0148 family)